MDYNLSATKVEGALVVLNYEVFEGVHYISVSCHDYEHFRLLPDAVLFHGQTLGKSAWNSDKEVAYYRSNMGIASKV